MAALLTSSILTSGNVSLVNASGTTAQTLLTVGSGVTGALITGISAVSNDSAAHTLVFSITRSGVDYDKGSLTVAATSTITKATAKIGDIFPHLRAADGLKLGPSDVLKVRCLTTAVTSGKKIDVQVDAEGWA